MFTICLQFKFIIILSAYLFMYEDKLYDDSFVLSEIINELC